MTLIEIRPHHWGWKAFETPGVEPVFPKKDQALDYAQNRACFRSGQHPDSQFKRRSPTGDPFQRKRTENCRPAELRHNLGHQTAPA
jgi:hypothetical protein